MEKRKLSSVWEKTKGEPDLPHISGTRSNIISISLNAYFSPKKREKLWYFTSSLHVQEQQGKTNVTNSINN